MPPVVTRPCCPLIVFAALSCSVVFPHVVQGWNTLPPTTPPASSRRHWLHQGLALLISSPTPAVAVSPINADNDRMTQLRIRLRPFPPLPLLRSNLNRDFAVVLLRSSYNACDTLDVIPMPQFQRDFFLLRQAEYTAYTAEMSVRQQGDVTDPNYFDVLSLAQYQTIARSVASPVEAVFLEEQAIPEDATTTTTTTQSDPTQRFRPVVVRRTYRDSELVSVFDQCVGDAILDWLQDTYRDTPIALPERVASLDTIGAGLDQLVKLFLINGFAWDGRVERQSTSYRLFLTSPATAYAGRVLSFERTCVRNDFLGKTAKAWLRRNAQGWVVSNYQVTSRDGQVEETRLTVANI